MHFIRGKTSIDLGDTLIENIFIDDFMPSADGTYVKVYLLGYKYACNPGQYANFTNENIARTLGILLSDVIKAWDYWEERRIIKKHYLSGDKSGDFTVEFLNLKQLYIDNFCNPEVKLHSERDRGYSPSDLTEAMQDQKIREMFHAIQQLMCRPLNPGESLQCLEWLYDLKMPHDIILEAFKYSIENRGVKSVKYVNAIINNWYDNNINSLEKLEAMLEATDKRYSLYNMIFKAMGITRNPSKKEKEIMDKWFDEYRMPVEVIVKACDTAFMRIPNPTLNYIDGIITDWHKNNLTSVEDVESNIKNERPSRRRGSKNKFHNFDQPMLKYTKEQLDEILFKKKPSI
jgi:DnaD/phage-associated family protein